jgi:hypothetical protein
MKTGQLVRINKTSGTKRIFILDDDAQVTGAIMLRPTTMGILLGGRPSDLYHDWYCILTEGGMGWVHFKDLVLV